MASKLNRMLKKNADKKIKALHPGKRTSASGATYYENRGNRSDVDRRKKYAKGGKPTENYFKIGDLAWCPGMGKAGLAGLVMSDKNKEGEYEALFRGMSGDVFDIEESELEVVDSSNIYLLENKSDISAYESIAKKNNITLNSVYSEMTDEDNDEYAKGGKTFRSTFDVRTSNGEITANVETGEVVKVVVDPDGDKTIAKIEKFDIAEWKKTYGKEKVDSSIDILDLGYWMKDGTYEEPAQDWRDDMKLMAEDNYAKGGALSQIITSAKEVDNQCAKTIQILLDKGYLGKKPIFNQWNSGGGCEHIAVQRPDKKWLLWSNIAEGVLLTKEKYETPDDVYEEFWEDDGTNFTESFIPGDNNGNNRKPATIAQDVIDNKWVSLFAKGGSVKPSKDGDRHAYRVRAYKTDADRKNKKVEYESPESLNWDDAKKKQDELLENGKYSAVSIMAVRNGRESSVAFYEKGGQTGAGMSGEKLENALRNYAGAALWSSDDDNEQPLDANYDITDIDSATLDKMRADVKKFFDDNAEDIKASELTDDQVAHTFWLSREGHGSGFFDYTIESQLKKRLDKAADDFGVFGLYVGDSGKIYGGSFASGGELNTSTPHIAITDEDIPESLYWHLYNLDRRFVDCNLNIKRESDGAFTITNQDNLSLTIEKRDSGIEGSVYDTLTELMGNKSFAKGGSLKDRAFPNCNLWLRGWKLDTNGNKVILVGFPNDRSFSIQTNGVLKESNRFNKETNLGELTDEQMSTIEKEVCEYVKEFGSKDQKSRLKTYSQYAKGGKTGKGLGKRSDKYYRDLYAQPDITEPLTPVPVYTGEYGEFRTPTDTSQMDKWISENMNKVNEEKYFTDGMKKKLLRGFYYDKNNMAGYANRLPDLGRTRSGKSVYDVDVVHNVIGREGLHSDFAKLYADFTPEDHKGAIKILQYYHEKWGEEWEKHHSINGDDWNNENSEIGKIAREGAKEASAQQKKYSVLMKWHHDMGKEKYKKDIPSDALLSAQEDEKIIKRLRELKGSIPVGEKEKRDAIEWVVFLLQEEIKEKTGEKFAAGGSLGAGDLGPGDNVMFKDTGKILRVLDGNEVMVRDASGGNQTIPLKRIIEKFQAGGVALTDGMQAEGLFGKGGYTSDEGEYSINVHGDEPHDYKIVCRKATIDDKVVEVCYHETNDKVKKGVEIYSGANYIVGSTDKSYSRVYPLDKVPSKYASVVEELKQEHARRLGLEKFSEGGSVDMSFTVEYDDQTSTAEEFIDKYSDELTEDDIATIKSLQPGESTTIETIGYITVSRVDEDDSQNEISDKDQVDYLSDHMSEDYSEDDAVEKFIYLTTPNRSNGSITEDELREAYHNKTMGLLIKQYDPVAFEASKSDRSNSFAKGGKAGGKSSKTFYDAAKKYLKEAYGLGPGDIDFDMGKAKEAEADEENPFDYIDSVAEKHGLTKMDGYDYEKTQGAKELYKKGMHVKGGTVSYSKEKHLPGEYYETFTLPGNGHKKYNIFQGYLAGGSKTVAKKLFPSYSYEDHVIAAKKFLKKYEAAQQDYENTLDLYALKEFGRKLEAKDYKVAGVYTDDFSDEAKDALRAKLHEIGEYRVAFDTHHTMLNAKDKKAISRK